MRLFPFGLLCVGLTASGNASAPDVTAKMIASEVYYHQPLAPCEIPTAVVRIAQAVQVPLGVEQLASDCLPAGHAGDPPLREKVYLTGMTVRDALDRLVAVDPRYRWGESDGVIVVRPVAAWANRTHFLHRALPAFGITNENMGAALDEWRRAMWGADAPRAADHMRAEQRTAEGSRPFTVVLADGATAIEALDHIVRVHGALYWEVRYCQPRAEARYAGVWLWTLGPDRTGLGVPLKERRGVVSGKTTDACVDNHDLGSHQRLAQPEVLSFFGGRALPMMAQLVEAGKLTRDDLRALEAAVETYERQRTHDRANSDDPREGSFPPGRKRPTRSRR